MINPVEKYRSIGGRIKKARESAHMSQADLAERLGFESPTAVSLIESGQRKVTITVLEKISDVLHTDINFFLGKEVKSVGVQFALRSEKNLSKDDKDKILEFIEFVKNKKSGR